jgi:hypothetical protein
MGASQSVNTIDEQKDDVENGEEQFDMIEHSDAVADSPLNTPKLIVVEPVETVINAEVIKQDEKEKTNEELWSEWLEPLKEQFGQFSYNRIMENDTQYDIISFRKQFSKKYRDIFGKPPPPSTFSREVKKLCKKETLYKRKVFEYYPGTDEHWSDQRDDQYDTQYRNEPDDHYQ